MELTTQIIIAIAAIAIFFIVYLTVRKTNKDQIKQINYRGLFAVGISFIPIGIATENFAFLALALVFLSIALANRKKWKKEKKWSELTTKEKQVRIVILSLTSILLIAGIVTFFVYN